MPIVLPEEWGDDAIALVAARIRARAEDPTTKHQNAEWERCSQDLVYWINTYVKTFDPRLDGNRRVPFVLYDFQVEVVLWLEECYRAHRDVVIEKSRDMGVSWTVLAWITWHLVFDRDFQFLVGSRKEDFVDNRQLDSLIPKVAFILQNLPPWQLDKVGYDPLKHRTWMSIKIPGPNNNLSGESSNPNFGRGGRYSGILLDEFAFFDFADSALAATADATPFRAFVSTPNGQNAHYRVRQSANKGDRSPSLKTLHWRLHPNKDDAWYEAEKERRTPLEIARELDISYESSIEGQVYPEITQVKVGQYPFVPGWPLYTSWDFGLGDATAMLWWQRNPINGLWRVVDAYQNDNRTVDFYVPFVTGDPPSGIPYGYTEFDLAKIAVHKGYGPAIHYGDPAGEQRNQVTGTSVITELAKHGILVGTKPEVNTFAARWQATKMFLRKIEGINEETCQPLLDAMRNARFPAKRESYQGTVANIKPVHNWTSHLRTAVEFMAVNEPVMHVQTVASNVMPSELSIAHRMHRVR